MSFQLPQAQGSGVRAAVYRSAAMTHVLERAALYASVPRNVLLVGPTGVGKGLVARIIHETSGVPGSFVTLAGGELADSLALSQLFGHERGAFTDARSRHLGAFEQAARGTLFLDEVHHWTLPVQSALLRALAEREFTPLGASRAIPATCRVVFASTRTVESLGQQGFLPDLQHRLPHLRIEIPALAERRADILPLAEAVLDRTRRELDLARPTGFGASAIQAMLGYSWPGNVRELEGAVDEAFIHAHADGAKDVLAVHFRPGIASQGVSLTKLDDETQAAAMSWAMERTGGNSCAAARLLSVHRNTLTNWRRDLRPPEDGGAVPFPLRASGA